MFVTGHGRSDDDTLHWPTLAAAATQGITLVIYMGVSTVEALQQGLLEGLAPGTPVALVQRASLPAERQWHTTLGALADVVRREGVGSPAIIIVGDVLRAMEHWRATERVRVA